VCKSSRIFALFSIQAESVLPSVKASAVAAANPDFICRNILIPKALAMFLLFFGI
jgi:hypothetical protein